jgi:hypothetical protein
VIEDVPGQQHLALAAVELTEIQPGGPQRDRPPVDMVDRRGVEVGVPPPDPDHDPGNRRVVVAATDPGYQVDEVADLFAGLVENRGTVQADERDDVLPHLARGHQPLRVGTE